MQDTEEKARSYVFRLLSYRERSRREVEARLEKRKHSPETIRKVLNYFTKIDLINDERFARLWVRSRLNYHPRSAYLIRRELKEKGVEEESIDRALDEEMPPEREGELLLQLARSRWDFYRRDEEFSRKRKTFAYLARRGFSPGAIQTAIREVSEDESD